MLRWARYSWGGGKVISEYQRLLLSYLYFCGPKSEAQLRMFLGVVGKKKERIRTLRSLVDYGLIEENGNRYYLTDYGESVLKYIFENYYSESDTKRYLEMVVGK